MKKMVAVALLLALFSSAHAAECTLGVGRVLNHPWSPTNAASFGCEINRWELRAFYVGPQDVQYETAHRGPIRELSSAYGAVSAMRIVRFSAGPVVPQLGFGVFIKRDDRNVHRIRTDTRQSASGNLEYVAVTRGNSYVELPVSFSLMAGVRWHNWAAHWNHASNAGLKAPNWGQDLLQIEYVWNW